MGKDFLLIFFIAEGNFFKTDISFHMLQRNCIGRILNIRCNRHHFQKTVITAVSVLELLRKIHKLCYRLRKVVDIQKKGHQVRRRKNSISQEHGPAIKEDTVIRVVKASMPE